MGRRVLVRLGEGIPGRRNSINKGSEVCCVERDKSLVELIIRGWGEEWKTLRKREEQVR